jgi:NTP pyrophosphatase (non-canonical NTP hydrolase)
MDLNQYQSLAMRTKSPMADWDRDLMVSALALGEAGEVQNIIKKHYEQGHPLDKERLVDELGDMLWGIARVCEVLGVPLEQVATYNIEKLRQRYPDGFSVEASINRAR